MWRLLSAYRPRFTRQLSIDPYTADLACRQAKLIAEVDGSQHADSDHDVQRTRFLEAQGWTVMRFWNSDVNENAEGVAEAILARVGELIGAAPQPRSPRRRKRSSPSLQGRGSIRPPCAPRMAAKVRGTFAPIDGGYERTGLDAPERVFRPMSLSKAKTALRAHPPPPPPLQGGEVHLHREPDEVDDFDSCLALPIHLEKRRPDWERLRRSRPNVHGRADVRARRCGRVRRSSVSGFREVETWILKQVQDDGKRITPRSAAPAQRLRGLRCNAPVRASACAHARVRGRRRLAAVAVRTMRKSAASPRRRWRFRIY